MNNIRREEAWFYKMLFADAPSVRILTHILFWIFFVFSHFSFTLAFLSENQYKSGTLVAAVVYFIRLIPLYYLCVILFDLCGKFLGGITLLIVIMVSYLLINHLLCVALFEWIQYQYGFQHMPANVRQLGAVYTSSFKFAELQSWLLLFNGFSEMELLILPVSVKVAKYAIQQSYVRENSQKEALKMELKMLRSQLSPHFVFNVINATYAKILPLSEEAAGYLQKTAGILRYALYDTNEEFISLEKEITCMQQYIELESIRNGARCQITFDQQGLIKPEYTIPTLLLMTLVENAFKHAVHITRHDSRVDLRIKIADDKLEFTISNSKPSQPALVNRNGKGGNGIGLFNLERRLALYYPQAHHFKKLDTDTEFSISLSLPLNVSSKN